MKHWIDFLPEGPGVRYKRIMLERSERLKIERQKAMQELAAIELELIAEEARIEKSILTEWTQDEIEAAKEGLKEHSENEIPVL